VSQTCALRGVSSSDECLLIVYPALYAKTAAENAALAREEAEAAKSAAATAAVAAPAAAE
jgi:hypothetical protein